ncbi:hypothetical protein M404DRAFT_26049 [Pisolithus tinctorius Marx 270]|uniref:Uncharacterized protein n=1 Tax=Pisolithus tinctorius Marx 270 TaxID=870435 RepID=A0A0C3PAG6_PISTI|nr:hypothetical protein M404DRAFT_26049 [Pisolithus tinctorius Marx 270]
MQWNDSSANPSASSEAIRIVVDVGRMIATPKAHWVDIPAHHLWKLITLESQAQMPTHLHLPAPITSSSTITLDAISHYSVFPDLTGMPDHDPSNVAVDLVGIDISIEGLEEGYGEEYNSIVDTEGEDDMMEQGRDVENAGGVAE